MLFWSRGFRFGVAINRIQKVNPSRYISLHHFSVLPSPFILFYPIENTSVYGITASFRRCLNSEERDSLVAPSLPSSSLPDLPSLETKLVMVEHLSGQPG